MHRHSASPFPTRIALAYVLIGAGWLALSHWLLSPTAGDRGPWFSQPLLPALGFVLVTALLLYFLIRAQIRAVEHRESRYRSLLETTSQMIWFADATGRLFDVSNAYEGLVGGQPAGIEQRQWLEAIHPDDIARAKQAWQRAVDRGEPYVAEFRLRMRNGEYRSFESRAAPLRDKHGRIEQWVGTTTDIHDRKRMESSLTDSELNLNLAIKGLNIGFWEWDFQSNRFHLSEEWLANLGLADDDVPDDADFPINLIHPDDFARLTALKQEVETEPRDHYEVEFRLRHKDGHYLWVMALGTLVRNHNRIPRRMQGINIDITGRKRTEEALRESQRHLLLVMQGGDISLWEWDMQSDVVRYSERLIEQLGFAGDELEGTMAAFTALIHPDDAAALNEAWHGAVSAGSDSFKADLRIRHKTRGYRWYRTQAQFIRDERGEPATMIGAQMDITELVESKERQQYLATHDDLLGLPNRRLMSDLLAGAIGEASEAGGKFGLVVINVDHFKSINDSLGHKAGDSVLKEAVQRIRCCLNPGDTLCRPGGDEFTIIARGLDDAGSCRRMGQRVLQAFGAPFRVDEQEVFLSATIGISLYPDDADSADTMIMHADMALHRGKAQGRKCVCLFSIDMEREAVDWLKISNGLQYAIANRELFLEYQPIYEVATGRICSFEALLRWHSPTIGMVPPNLFIPVAEANGLIEKIGDYVITQACIQLAKWRECGHTDIRLAVNVSARQFQSAEFVRRLESTIRNFNLTADALELEITETDFMQDVTISSLVLEEISRRGYGLSIDDFGTGYSSLSYLKRFSIDTLKIDKSFIEDIGVSETDAQIVEAIIAMAHSLDIRVVAEGVETAGQLAFIEQHGCEYAQGHYLSKSVSDLQALALLERARERPMPSATM